MSRLTDAGPVSKSASVASPHLAELLTLFSPAFPIGAFAWSHGLETAVAERVLTEGASVEAWVRVLLDRGSGWNDAVLLVEAYAAHQAGDAARFAAVAELAEALAGSAERRAETLALGAAFAEASQPWAATGWAEGTEGADSIAYPVAVGRLAAEAGFGLDETLLAFVHGFAASLVSAAVRLVPLAQSEAVRILRRLEPDIRVLAERAGGSTLDDLGSAALGSDIAALRHETLPTRLFRS